MGHIIAPAINNIIMGCHGLVSYDPILLMRWWRVPHIHISTKRWRLFMWCSVWIAHNRLYDPSVDISTHTAHPNKHCIDVIMNAMAFQITCVSIVCSTIFSDADHKKTFKLSVTGLWPVDSPHKGLMSFMFSSCNIRHAKGSDLHADAFDTCESKFVNPNMFGVFSLSSVWQYYTRVNWKSLRIFYAFWKYHFEIIFLNEKCFVFLSKFHWNLFQWTVNYHWFR